jgi:hypothetical protein
LKQALTVVTFVLAAAIFAALAVIPPLVSDENSKARPCYVGVAFCGNTTREAEMLIDRVKDYTNLFILQSGPVSKNETATNEICDYAVNAGLKIVVYFGNLNPRALTNETMWRVAWINTTKARWGESFLGIYYYDEPGGLYLDSNWNSSRLRFFSNWTYGMVVNGYVRGFNWDRGTVALKANSIPIFVSDYALYWFDYLAGYDVVLAQAGWNNSFPQDIALIRGAAKLQHKDWGVMITWKYNQPPYLDNDENIYEQMLEAYKAGAKYIAVFNYPRLDGNDYGVLSDKHFEKLEKFWKEVVNNPSVEFGSTETEAVLVLPKNYGWGMRRPDDSIWGIWGPDEKSPQIWELSRKLLANYGFSLDIVYEDAAFPFEGNYSKVYYWNSSIP